jgi:hypothetical protein
MKARILLAALAILVASGLAWAGDPAKKASDTDAKAKMEMMMAEMSKCMICKNMAANMPKYGPVMKSEVVKMDNGMTMIHAVSDPKLVPLYHTDCDAMAKAGMASMELTDEQAKTELCTFCQDVRSIAKSGGQMSHGKTKDGFMMVIMSGDPTMQTRIASLADKCASMMSDEAHAAATN